jgi:hypothetical protein
MRSFSQNPLLVVLQHGRAVVLPHSTTRTTLLNGSPRLVLLQISKIATILRWIQLGESLHPTQKSYRAGSITLQLVRPDITQSCSWLADLRSRASQIPTPSRTTAMIRPAMAPRRLSPWSSGSGIGRFTSIEAQVALLS